MSYDNIDPRTKTSTDTPLSDAGESSSEQAGAIIASLQQQQLQRSVNSTAQNIMMSKAEHEAIFGRPNSNRPTIIRSSLITVDIDRSSLTKMRTMLNIMTRLQIIIMFKLQHPLLLVIIPLRTIKKCHQMWP